MVVVRTLVRPNSYRDSVALMRLSSELNSLPGVIHAAAMMATDANKALMAEAGLLGEDGDAAGPADLLIGVAADSPAAAERLIGGVGLGFANAVRPGPIGLVSASGTGLQAVSSLVHRYGSGVSHGLGTGSRDLSAAVGGLMMRQAIDLLADDPATTVLVLISKPPDPATAAVVYERIRDLRKPVVTCFLSAPLEDARRVGAHPVT